MATTTRLVPRFLAALTCLALSLVLSGPPRASADESIEPPPGVWTNFTTANDIVFDIEPDPAREHMWVASSGGAVRWDLRTGTYTKLGVMDGLPELRVLRIDVHASGDVWFSTDEGAVRLAPDGFTALYTTDQGLPSNIVRGVRLDAEDRLWFATSLGLARLDPDENWEVYTTAEGSAARLRQRPGTGYPWQSVGRDARRGCAHHTGRGLGCRHPAPVVDRTRLDAGRRRVTRGVMGGHGLRVWWGVSQAAEWAVGSLHRGRWSVV